MRARWTLALLLAACGGAGGRPALPPDACRPADDDARPWETRGVRVPVPVAFAPRRGAARPRVVVQAFSDFECPFCARAVPTLERVIADYGACVQVVWRNRPMRYHPNAEAAARVGLEIQRQAGDDAFWRYHDRIFAHQRELSPEAIVAHAEGLASDLDAVRAVIAGDAHRPVIERDREAIDAIEPGFGTPTFVVNGAVIHGARPYEAFRDVIEDAILDAYAPSGGTE